MATTLQIALIKMLKTPSGPSLRLQSVAEVAPHAWRPGDSQQGWGQDRFQLPEFSGVPVGSLRSLPLLVPHHPRLTGARRPGDPRPDGAAWRALLGTRAGGFALSSYLPALWLQNAWGRGTVARRAKRCRARSGLPASQHTSWRRSREPGETSPASSGAGCPPCHPWGQPLRPSLACSLLPLPCPARPSSLHQPLGELPAPGPVPDL